MCVSVGECSVNDGVVQVQMSLLVSVVVSIEDSNDVDVSSQ